MLFESGLLGVIERVTLLEGEGLAAVVRLEHLFLLLQEHHPFLVALLVQLIV